MSREIDMYRLEDIIREFLKGTAIKTIARQQRISRNTIKKYRNYLKTILDENPDINSEVCKIMDKFHDLRKTERYSKNHGWLNDNNDLVNQLILKCDNYVRLFEVLCERGFDGSYSSLQRYLFKYRESKEKIVFRVETKPGEIAQVDFGYCGMIYDEYQMKEIKAWIFVMVLGFSRDAYYEIVKKSGY